MPTVRQLLEPWNAYLDVELASPAPPPTSDPLDRPVFGPDNVWNGLCDEEAVDPENGSLLTSVPAPDGWASSGLIADFGPVWSNPPNGVPALPGIPVTIVRGGQELIPYMQVVGPEGRLYTGSAPGPFPVPANAPVEPVFRPAVHGDRHLIVIDADAWRAYEFFWAGWHVDGTLEAAFAQVWDLGGDGLNPPGQTSADGAGMPIFPGLVRYEAVQKAIKDGSYLLPRALRLTLPLLRQAYVRPPASHAAGNNHNPALPAWGSRWRLKATVDEVTAPDGRPWSPVCRTIITTLKRRGAFCADQGSGGSGWQLSGCPDARWDAADLRRLRLAKGSQWELVKMGSVVPASTGTIRCVPAFELGGTP